MNFKYSNPEINAFARWQARFFFEENELTLTRGRLTLISVSE